MCSDETRSRLRDSTLREIVTAFDESDEAMQRASEQYFEQRMIAAMGEENFDALLAWMNETINSSMRVTRTDTAGMLEAQGASPDVLLDLICRSPAP